MADIELMLDGCRECCTYKLLHTLSLLGVVDGSTIWDMAGRPLTDKRGIMMLQVPPESIKAVLQQRMDLRWSALQPDPRIATSLGIEICTHAAWVLGTSGEGWYVEDPST